MPTKKKPSPKKAATKPRRGRPPKFKGGVAQVTTYFAPETLDSLRRFAGYQTALEGKNVTPSDVVAKALEVYKPFRAFLRLKQA